MRIDGIPVFPGKVLERALLVPGVPAIDRERKAELPLSDAQQAVERGIHALDASLARWEALVRQEKLKADMLEMQRTILNDSAYRGHIADYLKEGYSPESAALRAAEDHAKVLEELDDPLLSERAQDMRDVGLRLGCRLAGLPYPEISALERDAVLVSDSLSPTLLSTAETARIKGILLRDGSKTSHIAILAAGLGIPTVVGCAGLENISEGETVFLDSEKGFALIGLTAEDKQRFAQAAATYAARREELNVFAEKAALTADGARIRAVCNVMGAEMADRALAYGADGIGLFRTEFLYMERNRLPSEEEQFSVYRSMATKFGQKPVTIRTMDIGGDKRVESLHLEPEQNAFLGYRAIRICLDRQDLFLTQLRAILRASAFGSLQIMFPMISDTEEVRKAKELLKKAMSELESENRPFRSEIPVGIMVETPAAAVLAEQFAGMVDFFSIGSNDLTQYTLAVDRMNPKIAHLYNSLSPAVLRLIAHTIRCADSAGIACSLCGEMAGDPVAIPLLLGMGLRKFSVNPSSLLRLKKLLSLIDLQSAKALASRALELSTAGEAAALVKSRLGPEYGSWISEN